MAEAQEKLKYPFEVTIVEMVRRGLLTIQEARCCMFIGGVPEDIFEVMESRINKNPKVNIPGYYGIKDDDDFMKVFRQIRLSINPIIAN